AEERMLEAGERARLVGADLDERLGVGVIDLELLALGGGPHELVTVGGHLIEDLHLALGDLAVGVDLARLLAGLRIVLLETQVRAAAEDRVAIDGAIAVEPNVVAFQDSGANLIDVGWRRGCADEVGLDDVSEQHISVLVEMDAVDGTRRLRLRVRLE